MGKMLRYNSIVFNSTQFLFGNQATRSDTGNKILSGIDEKIIDSV